MLYLWHLASVASPRTSWEFDCSQEGEQDATYLKGMLTQKSTRPEIPSCAARLASSSMRASSSRFLEPPTSFRRTPSRGRRWHALALPPAPRALPPGEEEAPPKLRRLRAVSAQLLAVALAPGEAPPPCAWPPAPVADLPGAPSCPAAAALSPPPCSRTSSASARANARSCRAWFCEAHEGYYALEYN